ncbi:cupin domain-containing protein [Bradyrhizobium sp. JYMT SZCCT0428]|uniref:cupin domain-containing protein n=1 Tax=Bradyrhizobium sp. JYMT SZCCT0428 TaxID=2807673 RepID=UPI001BA5161B|nr:cupin domain-containing protein [Bradyrhizobium sp. JYMT SZCCT0428]MBR1156307.1 cupin domain-containing protein [Bradyrhizobium sp. JYMT SZCCT0428]
MTQKQMPIVHAPAAGEANSAFGFKRYFRITPEDTGGAFCVFEEEIEEGAGPPLHIHHVEHEMFTVLSGSVKFHCDGTEAVAEAGTTALIPPGACHAFKGIGPGTSRVLVMLSPGNGEGFFREVEKEGLSSKDGMDRVNEIAAKYSVEFVGPPLD